MGQAKLPFALALLHTAALGAAFLFGALDFELSGSDLVRTILVVVDFPVFFFLFLVVEFLLDIHAIMVPILLGVLGALQWAFIGSVITAALNRQRRKQPSAQHQHHGIDDERPHHDHDDLEERD